MTSPSPMPAECAACRLARLRADWRLGRRRCRRLVLHHTRLAVDQRGGVARGRRLLADGFHAASLGRSPDAAGVPAPKMSLFAGDAQGTRQHLTSIAGTHAPAPEILVVATVPPTAVDQAWWETDTIAQAQQLPGASVCIDRDGREAARFGAATSGTIMLFDAARQRALRRWDHGRPRSRRPSAGADSLAGLLRGESNVASKMPAFGCRLCLPQPPAAAEMTEHN